MFEFIWSPGTGSRLDLVVSGSGTRWLVAWMSRGGSGGGAVRFDGSAPDAAYIMEKMSLSPTWEDDAAALWFLCRKLVSVQPRSASQLASLLPGKVAGKSGTWSVDSDPMPVRFWVEYDGTEEG